MAEILVICFKCQDLNSKHISKEAILHVFGIEKSGGIIKSTLLQLKLETLGPLPLWASQ